MLQRSLVVAAALAAVLAAQERGVKQPARLTRDAIPGREAPPSLRYSLGEPREFRLAAPAEAEFRALQMASDPPLIGIHRAVAPEALRAGSWESAPDGQRLWRLALRSPGSIGIRVRFSSFSVGAGKVWIRGEGGDVDGPYTGKGLFEEGQFWSATIPADAAILEYQPEGGQPDSLPFQITQISHQAVPLDAPETAAPVPLQAAALGPLAGQSKDPAGGCNLDVNCFPEWQDSMKMVAHIVFEVEGGQAACSGALMATRNNSFKPYFLTAAHCVDSEAVARTVEAYWGYQTASCNAARPAGKGTLKSSPGSNLLAAGGFGGGDYALLLLKDVPSGVLFAGWDPGDPGSGSHFTGIHHPRGSYKRISFGTRIADTNVSVDGVPAPGSSFYTVVWNLGATEPGSSGSPAFTSPGIVAGTLSYGLVSPEICNLPVKISGYGRFSLAYPAMQAYLEDLPSSVVSPSPATLDFHGANGTIAAPSRQTVTLTTQSRGAVSFNARADAPWITLSAVSGTVASGSPATLQISIDPTTLKTPRVYTSTVTITAGAAAPQFVTVRLDLRVDRSSVTASVSPNPVTQQEPDPEGARWFFELRLEEKAGVATRLTSIRIDGVDYSTRIADWFGSDRIPALGGIRAGLRMANLYVPSERYFELGGVDDSGQRWSETIVVPFR